MGRRNEHSHDSIKQMAIEAGRNILQTKGFSGLSARNVAGEIGYTAGTLYNVFDNFTDLICHINSKTLDDLKEHLEVNLSPGQSAVDAMNELAKAYVDYAKDNTHLWRALFEFQHPDDYQLPQWYSDKVRNLLELPTTIIATMFDGDSKRAEYEARVIWGGVHGICILGITDRLGLGSEELLKSKVQSLITNYMKGLNVD